MVLTNYIKNVNNIIKIVKFTKHTLKKCDKITYIK